MNHLHVVVAPTFRPTARGHLPKGIGFGGDALNMSALPAASLGARHQWERRYGSWPVLLDRLAMAPRCLTGLLRMRGLAHGDAARAAFGQFEARLAQTLRTSAIPWPPGFGTFTSRVTRTLGERPTAQLPRLAPEQSLLLTGPLRSLPLAAARVYASCVETSFGADADLPLGDDALCRALLPAVPQPWRGAWERGLGLDPPRVFAEEKREALMSLLRGLLRGEPMPAVLPMGVTSADAVVLAFAVVTLRWAGEVACTQQNTTPSARAA